MSPKNLAYYYNQTSPLDKLKQEFILDVKAQENLTERQINQKIDKMAASEETDQDYWFDDMNEPTASENLTATQPQILNSQTHNKAKKQSVSFSQIFYPTNQEIAQADASIKLADFQYLQQQLNQFCTVCQNFTNSIKDNKQSIKDQIAKLFEQLKSENLYNDEQNSLKQHNAELIIINIFNTILCEKDQQTQTSQIEGIRFQSFDEAQVNQLLNDIIKSADFITHNFYYILSFISLKFMEYSPLDIQQGLYRRIIDQKHDDYMQQHDDKKFFAESLALVIFIQNQQQYVLTDDIQIVSAFEECGIEKQTKILQQVSDIMSCSDLNSTINMYLDLTFSKFELNWNFHILRRYYTALQSLQGTDKSKLSQVNKQAYYEKCNRAYKGLEIYPIIQKEMMEQEYLKEQICLMRKKMAQCTKIFPDEYIKWMQGEITDKLRQNLEDLCLSYDDFKLFLIEDDNDVLEDMKRRFREQNVPWKITLHQTPNLVKENE